MEALLVLPSPNVLDAAEAAFGEVCFEGDFVCDRALAAEVFDFEAVDLLVNVFEALLADFFPVTFVLAVESTSKCTT